MSLTQTGMIIHNRTTDKDYAMHSDCAERMAQLQIDIGLTMFPDTRIVVEIGPLFAPETEWSCVMTDCTHKGSK